MGRAGHRQLKKSATSEAETQQHGLINYKETKEKCRHLKKINLQMDFAAGVYQSVWTGDTVSYVGISNPAL